MEKVLQNEGGDNQPAGGDKPTFHPAWKPGWELQGDFNCLTAQRIEFAVLINRQTLVGPLGYMRQSKGHDHTPFTKGG